MTGWLYVSLFEHSLNDKPIIWRTFPIVVTREDGASCDEIKLGGSFEQGVKCSKIFRRCSIDISPYRHARRKLISFERNWSWWWNVACYSLRVSRATALRCSRYADIRMSLFLFLFPSLSRRIFRSSSSTSIHSGEYYV